ncbi:MAG: hypothetical protein MK052_05785, partial [Alphaproteobacteria bacterium]|nr:hypothetical protein [Alphaproteobacteria bacterium]
MYLWIYDAVLLISAFIFAVAATGGAYALMRKLEIVDIPNERSNHSQPTPRGGGLGIVFASVAFLIVADAPGSLIWGIILLAGLSFWDDLHGVCAKKRLIAQVIISAWAVFSSYEGHVLAGILPQWTEMLLLTFALVWFLNLFNFMDGSDGLAASESICISLGILAIAAIAVVSVQLTSFALIALGASLGFILW